jgi:serine/threonine-protein kinase
VLSEALPRPVRFGRYTLYERIGRGGMAEVFKGRIEGPGGFERVFVIKRILPALTADSRFVQMLIDEAKLSARLIHPNIVQIFELGAVDGEYFISMEHVPGHDLAETTRALWKRGGAPRPELVAYIGREICRALAYAHAYDHAEDGRPLGIIHRDVSPTNVMLSTGGGVKLLDFGIAKMLGEAPEATDSGTLKGKYAYMAPEQVEKAGVDHRTDIFAAGIVLHEVLAGRRLFKGGTDVETLDRVLRCEVRPPSDQNPHCPPALDDIVLRALARDPRDRFASAGEMADALDDLAHAAHFTPEELAVTLRELFGGESGAVPIAVDRIPGVSRSIRSRTIPPVFLSTSHPSSSAPDGPSPDARASRAGGARRIWRRGASWALAAVAAAAVGVAVAGGFGGRRPGRPAPPVAAAAAAIAPVAVVVPEPAPVEVHAGDAAPRTLVTDPSVPSPEGAPAAVPAVADAPARSLPGPGGPHARRPGGSAGKVRRRPDLVDPFRSAVLVDPFCGPSRGSSRSPGALCPAPARGSKQPSR